ncbi:MAG: hypothetical protein WA821_13085 [Anaerolineales bacterium]
MSARDATLSRFLQQTRNALAKSASFLAENRQNPLVARRHFASVQTMLERFHEFQPLFTGDEDGLLAANLILSLGRWPAAWGVSHVWENELKFSIKACNTSGRAALAAEAACLLAELCSARSAAGDLRRANRWAALAVEKAYLSKDARAIGQAVFVRLQTLLKSKKNESIPLLYEQALQAIEAASPDADSRLTALAFLCIPYARFLHRNGETQKAIQSITQMIDSLHPALALNLDIHKELYDLRGVLYWASGDYQAALADFDLEYALLNRKPDLENVDYDQNEIDVLLISVFANRALVFSTLGQLNDSAAMTLRAIELSRKVNASSLLMRQMGDLGRNKLCRGELQQALECLEEQRQMAQTANDTDQVYLATYNHAGTLIFAGRAQEARPDLLNLLKIFKRRKSALTYAGLLIDMSVCCWHLGELQTAKNYYQQACDFIVAQQLESFTPAILRCGALFEDKTNARANLEKALSLVRASNSKFDETACILHLAYLSDDLAAKQTYWRDALSRLEEMGALAWVEHKSPDDFVMLPFFSA